MGLGVAIGGGIVSLTVLAVIVSSSTTLQSIGDVSEAESELTQIQQILGDTSLQIDEIIAAEKNDEFVFHLTNIGTAKLWDFENFNLLVTYDGIVNGATTQITELLSYNPSVSTNVNCDGSIQGLSPGQWALGTKTQDNLDPGVLNPNELFQISSKLNNKFAVGGTGEITITTDTGYSLTSTFQVLNGTEECAWYHPDWKSRNKITIHNEKVPANATDFPFMFYGRDVDFKSLAQADGDDFLFTASDKVTKLDHEIESYDQSRGELTAWVKIPSLSSIEDTEIYIYYGNNAASNQENVAGVWSNGYEAVYHLHDDFTNSTDSVDAVNVGTVDTTGIVANAQDFERDDNTDHLDLGKWSISGNEITIQTWAKFESFDRPHARIIDKAIDTFDQDHVFFLGTINDGSDLRFSLKTGTDDASGTSTLTTDSNLVTDTWHLLAGTYDGATMTSIKDGVSQGTQSKTGNIRENNWDIFVGNQPPDNSVQFDGILDEVRISSVARSIEWLQTEYNNIMNPEDFFTFEPKEPFLIWADLGWQYRKQITIDKDLIDAELEDFPLLVSVTDSDLTNAQSSGNDLVFTSSEGRIQLDHELEFFDSSDGTVASWIRVPTMFDNKDTVLYMYYGHNTTTNVENIEEVWDSNYKAVYHLKEQSVQESLEFEPTDMNSAAIAKIESATDKFAMWAPRDFSNGGFIHTVNVNPDGSIGSVIETQQFSGLGQDPDVIHVNGDVYAVAYEGPSELGWVVTSEILSDGTISDFTGTRSSYGHLDAYNFASGNEIDEPDIIKIGSTVYAVAYSYFGNDLYLETLDIPNDGAEITTIEDGNFLDSDGDYPEIINIGTDMFAIAYEDESNDGKILTIDIDSSGNIGSIVDSWEYETSNGETPDIINVAGDVYAIAYDGPGSDGFIRTINITSSGVITKSGYDLSKTRLEFDTNTGRYPDILQVFQEIYAIVYTGPGSDGYIKTLAIYPNGTISGIIDVVEFDTSQGNRPHIKLIDGDVYVISYEGAGDDGYVSTIAINKDGIMGDTAFDSTINDNTGYHNSEPLGTQAFIANGVDLEASDSQYINVPDSSSLDITGPITISAWVMSENNNQSPWEAIVTKGDDTYRLHMCGNGPSCSQGLTTDAFSFVVNTPGINNLGSTINPVRDEWHYVVGVYDGSTQTLYVNSTASTLTSISQAASGDISTNSFDIAIGENLQQTGRYWDGMIDEVRISDVARSLEWIQTEFLNQGSPSTFMSFGPQQEIQQ